MKLNIWKKISVITICNRQTINGETEEICLTTMGTYAEKGGNRYIIYQEYDQETGQPMQTSTLKITPNHAITLMRNNANRTNLILEEGKRHLCQYGTQFGSMMLGVFTKLVKIDLNDQGGSLQANYTLDLDTNLASENEIIITVKEA